MSNSPENPHQGEPGTTFIQFPASTRLQTKKDVAEQERGQELMHQACAITGVCSPGTQKEHEDFCKPSMDCSYCKWTHEFHVDHVDPKNEPVRGNASERKR
jgi:hypothetical protein